MPADVSFQGASRVRAADAQRLPIGFGLVIAGGISAGLWAGVFFVARALLG